jgi:hypothetical protein
MRLDRASVFVECQEPAVAGQHALSRHFIKICEQMVSEYSLPDLVGGFPVDLDFVGDQHHGSASATAGNYDAEKSTLPRSASSPIYRPARAESITGTARPSPATSKFTNNNAARIVFS